MKKVILASLVVLSVPHQPGVAKSGDSSWTDLEYEHAAKCAWASYSGVAAAIAKNVNSNNGVYNGAISRKSILNCVNVTTSSGVEPHLGSVNNTPYDDVRMGEEIALVPLMKIANCASGRSAISKSAISDVKRRSILSESEIAEAKRCDAAVAEKLTIDDSFTAKAYKEALVRQMNWNRKLSAWSGDLSKQHDAAVYAGCAWRNNELATRRYLVQHGYQRPGVTMRRYAGTMAPVLKSCLNGRPLNVVRIMDELQAFTSY